MPDDDKPPNASLDQSLSRMNDALARTPPAPAGAQGAEGSRRAEVAASAAAGRGSPATALGAMALLIFVLALVTGHPQLVALALVLAAAGGSVYALPKLARFVEERQGGPSSAFTSAFTFTFTKGASIGLGATVAKGALVEAGASIEMGAIVRRGAIVRSGAVVRMGAVISRDAVVEKGALVSWGAIVNRGAVVGENAIVGAGSIVREDARVAPGMRLSPGSIYAAHDAAAPAIAGPAAARPAAAAPAAVARDPRDERLAAVCDRLEAELNSSTEQVRAFLGGSNLTLASLRHACEDLSRRERSMRAEADPHSVAQLDEERAALQRRLAGEQDPQLTRSLQGAVAAIDELKRQRELLRLGADRLQAEHTRLLYTLDGLASQFVRMRTAGAGAGSAELEQSVLQLRAGIDAIADALEEVSREAPAALREFAAAPDAGLSADEPGAPHPRSRSR